MSQSVKMTCIEYEKLQEAKKKQTTIKEEKVENGTNTGNSRNRTK